MINYLRAYLGTLMKNEKGQGMAEYAIIIAVVALVAIAGFILLGTGIKDKITDAANSL